MTTPASFAAPWSSQGSPSAATLPAAAASGQTLQVDPAYLREFGATAHRCADAASAAAGAGAASAVPAAALGPVAVPFLAAYGVFSAGHQAATLSLAARCSALARAAEAAATDYTATDADGAAAQRALARGAVPASTTAGSAR